jgi:2-iminobutanoate/2-iminopropanoate deaminase
VIEPCLIDVANAQFWEIGVHGGTMRRLILLTSLVVAVVLLIAAGGKQKKVIVPSGATLQDTAPFSPGILDGETLYVSGQLGTDPKSGKIPEEFETEVRTCLQNVQKVLKAGGMDYDDVDSVQVYLTDIQQFARMNAVYTSVFRSPRPARATVGVAALAVPGAHIEIAAVARK